MQYSNRVTLATELGQAALLQLKALSLSFGGDPLSGLSHLQQTDIVGGIFSQDL